MYKTPVSVSVPSHSYHWLFSGQHYPGMTNENQLHDQAFSESEFLLIIFTDKNFLNEV